MYTATILTVILYECESWCLKYREESPMVFENRMLRRIFGLKRDEGTGERKKTA
jgi:hypothetical protein